MPYQLIQTLSEHWLLLIQIIPCCKISHYSDIMMSTMASQITGISIVCSTIHSGADQRKHQSYASLAFVRGIHQWPVNSPHKGPLTSRSGSKVVVHDTHSIDGEYLYQIWQWFLQWKENCGTDSISSTDKRINIQTDWQTKWNQYNPHSNSLAEGMR